MEESGFCGETASLDGQTLDSVNKLARLQVSGGKLGLFLLDTTDR